MLVLSMYRIIRNARMQGDRVPDLSILSLQLLLLACAELELSTLLFT